MKFCFTGDVDWAKETDIQGMIDFFRSRNVPLTLFITHPSGTVEYYYDNSEMRRFVGLHFNFCKNSTQGRTYEQVLDYCQSLWPSAVSYRCHRYFEDAEVAMLVAKREFKYDSNSVQFLQKCYPLHQWNGLMRYPVFWEDDVHTMIKGLPLKLKYISKPLSLEGIKVFNIHPIHFVKSSEKKFVKELLWFIQTTGGECCYLDDIYRSQDYVDFMVMRTNEEYPIYIRR
jgi:hypothetical protein